MHYSAERYWFYASDEEKKLMRQLAILTMIAAAAWLGACDLFKSSPDDEVPVEEPAETAVLEAAEIVEAVQELRQREAGEPIDVVEGDPSSIEGVAIPDAVGEEWAWFEKILFGGESVDLVVDDGRWADLARYDRETNRIVFKGDPRTDDEVAFAISMAANFAIEELAFDELGEADSVDQWLTLEVIRRAGPAFVSAVHKADRFDVGVDLDDLAERPELSAYIPGVGERLDSVEPAQEMPDEMEPPEGTDYFEQALQQLTLRKAISLGSALYRAGEWPGVEWGRVESPAMSDHIVRPQRWLDGDGASQWTWPEGFEDHRQEEGWSKEREGRVGPAMMSLWVEGLVGARAARTLYSGFMADDYRIYTRGEGEEQETVFNWLSAWETPHDAQEIGTAAEAVLGHYLGHEHRQSRFRVAVQGVNVAVSIYDQDREPDFLDAEVELLSAARTGYLSGESAPFAFSPTLYDRYAAMAGEATMDLDQEEWIDPAAGWRTEVDALDGWTVQRTDEAHVRWFANHPDGALIQWTTELINPLETEFGSEEYLDELATTFASSVDSDEDPDIQVTSMPADPTLEMEVIGLIDGRPLVLYLWQWQRGDVLVTFSIQGPEASFGDRFGEARSVLKKLETHGEPVQQREVTADVDPSEDEGIIEFRVDDE